MNEEIRFRLGLDADPLAQGLRKAERTLTGFKDKAVSGFSDLGSSLLGKLGLAGGVSVATMVMLDKINQYVEQISRTAESLGVSTDFVQGIREAATLSNFNVDSLEKAMTKLAQGLPEGSDVEKEFYRIADAIHATEDPLSRVKLATDAFGQKLGVQMIPMLSQGSVELRKITDQTNKLTEAQIRNLDEMHDKFESFGNKIKVTAAGILVEIERVAKGFAKLGRSFGSGKSMADIGAEAGKEEGELRNKIKGEREIREKAAALASFEASRKSAAEYERRLEDVEMGRSDTTEKRRLELLKRRKEFERKSAIDSTTQKEYQDHLIKVAELEAKIADIKQKQAEKEKELADKRKDLVKHLDEAFDKEKRQRDNLKEARVGFAFHTLEELAGVPSMGFGSIRGNILPPGTRAAQGIMADQQAAHNAAIWGRFADADFFAGRAARNFDALAEHDPFLKNPFKKMEEDIASSTKDIEKIRKTIASLDAENNE